MTISRKLGTLVVFGVPAIVGGGIAFAMFGENYTAVTVFEFFLILTAGSVIAR